MSQVVLIQRGPITEELFTTLLEGEMAEAGIVSPDGSVVEILLIGGHDLQNKLIGGGFQLTTGEPSIQAPAGTCLVDIATNTLWISQGWPGGMPTSGLDSPVEGSISDPTFLGWFPIGPGVTSVPYIDYLGPPLYTPTSQGLLVAD